MIDFGAVFGGVIAVFMGYLHMKASFFPLTPLCTKQFCYRLKKEKSQDISHGLSSSRQHLWQIPQMLTFGMLASCYMLTTNSE